MLKMFSIAMASALAVAAFAMPSASAAEWKPKRDITFMIPYGPGGGFDTISRKLTPFIQKHLGGKVNCRKTSRAQTVLRPPSSSPSPSPTARG